MSGSTALVLSNRSYPTPTVSSNFAKNLFDWETLSSVSSMPSGGSISRAGQAMMYDSTGKLTYAPNNLLLRSQEFNTTWFSPIGGNTITADTTVSPDGGTNADTVNHTNTADAPLRQSVTVTNDSNTYVASVYVKQGTCPYVSIGIYFSGGTTTQYPIATLRWSDLSVGSRYGKTANVTAVGNGWYRLSLVHSNNSTGSTSAVIDVRVMGDSAVAGYGSTTDNGTAIIWGAQLEAVTYQTTPSTYQPTTTAAYYGPRFDYDPVTLQPKGLLVEGTRTNICLSSQDMSTSSWTAYSSALSTTANSATAPDGTNTANTITLSANSRVQPISVTSGVTYTASVWLKTDTGSKNITIGDINQASSVNTVTVTTTWQRFSITITKSNAAAYIGIAQTLGTSPSTSGTVYAWGWQFEAASFASSYIPTTSVSIARAAETFSLTGYANRLVEAYYIDEETGGSYSGNSALSTGTVTISPPTFGWVTSLRAYQNAYAGSISSPSWLSFSRAGNAMYYDSTGTLTWAPANLLLNSATLSTQTVTVTSGATNILSFSGTGSITYSGAASGTLTGTGANNRVSVVLTMSTTSLTLTVSGTVTNAQLERVTYQTAPSAYIPTTSAAVYGPRYDYDPSTVPATPRGLLIEESRSNICLRSQEFDNAVWSIGNMDAFGSGSVANAIAAPDTTVTADFLRPNTTNSTHFVLQSITTLAGAYSFTVYAKAGGYNFVFLFNGTTANGRVFNIATGAIGGTAGNIAPTSSSITNVGNGWYRCEIVVTATAAANSWRVYPMSSDAASASFAGDGVSGVYLWGAQLEAGAFATSYIPTTTASVTRAADVAQLTGNAQTVLGGTSASVIAEISGTQTSFGQIVNHSGGTLLAKFSSNSQIYATKSDTTSLVASLGSGLNTANFRSAVAFAPNAMSLVANNGTVATAALGIQGAPVTLARLGSATSGFYINSWVTSLAFYNQKLPDAILKQKSTAGAPY